MTVLTPTGGSVWSGQEFHADLGKDRFVHFTQEERAPQILESGKLLMRPPYPKFGIDAVNAVSTVWGTFVPGVQTTHSKGNLVAILFRTNTVPKYGYRDEVVWDRDVVLRNPKIIPANKAVSMLRNTPEKIEDGDMVVYGKARAASVAQRFLEGKNFSLNIGDPILYGKYKNKKGIITGFKTGPKGDPIVVVEQFPNESGRKQPKDLKLFKIRYDKARAREKKAVAWGDASIGDWEYLIQGELDEGLTKAEEWGLEGYQYDVKECGDGPQVVLVGGEISDLDWFVSHHNEDLFYRHLKDPDGEWSPLHQHYGKASSARVAAKFQKKKEVPKADGKGTTTVYEYSEKQIQHRDREKAKRVEKLRKDLDKLRDQIKKDLKSKDDKTRMTALAVGLINDTFERVGNPGSAKEGHFGVTGWKVKHVTISGNKATFKYVGKSGVDQEKTTTDAGLVSTIKDAIKDKGKDDDVFGGDNRIDSSVVNEYLKPFDITAKDIRGLHANREMQRLLKSVRSKGGKLPTDAKEREKKLKDEFKEALEGAAAAVGHEASTLKSQYLVPGLEDDYLKDGVINEKLTKKGSAARVASRVFDMPFHKRAIININNATDGDSEELRGLYGLISSLTLYEQAIVQDMLIHEVGIDQGPNGYTLRGHWVEPDAVTELIGAGYLQDVEDAPILLSDMFQTKLRLYTASPPDLGVQLSEAFDALLQPIQDVVDGIVATKTPIEIEDEEAERLVRPDPKKKPPRTDLRRRLMEEKPEGDDDLKKDATGRVASRWRRRVALAQFLEAADEPEHKPGDTWKSKDKFVGKNNDGETQSFDSEDAAKAFATGKKDEKKDEEPDAKEDKAPEETKEDKAKREEADAEKAEERKQEILDETMGTFDSLMEGRILPVQSTDDPRGDFMEDLEAKVDAMSSDEREEFAATYSKTLEGLKKQIPDNNSLKDAREDIGKDLEKLDSKGVGEAMARAVYADLVTYNPLLVGDTPLSTDDKPASEKERREEEPLRRAKAEAAYDYFQDMNEDERGQMASRLSDAAYELDENSPRFREIQGLYNGLCMAAQANGEDPPSGGSNLNTPRVSESFGALFSAMKTVGEEKKLLGTVDDFSAPESQDAIRTAMSSMTDDELGDLIGGSDSPMYGLIETLTDPDKSKRLGPDQRGKLRKMIEDAVVDNVALLNPMAMEIAEVNGEKDPAKAAVKALKEFDSSKEAKAKRQSVMDALEEDEDEDEEAAKSGMSALELALQEMRKFRITEFPEFLKKKFKKAPERSIPFARADALKNDGDLGVLTQRFQMAPSAAR